MTTRAPGLPQHCAGVPGLESCGRWEWANTANRASAASAKGVILGRFDGMTVEKVSSTDAKNRLNALLADVERTGKTVIITNPVSYTHLTLPTTPYV